MKIHWFQHVPFEGLGSIENWALEHGHELSCTRIYAGEQPPTADNYDWLIVMGGPMGVDDLAEHPWIVGEKLAIRVAIDARKHVLGVCLGAQLIASVLGAQVAVNGQKEIGWFPVRLTQNAALSPFFVDFTDKFDAFHWHGDRFDCPRSGLRMALSDVCDQQAFVYKERVLGLQFHLETTPATAAALIEHCGHELVEGASIQTAEQMLAEPQRFTELNRLMAALLDRMAARVAATSAS